MDSGLIEQNIQIIGRNGWINYLLWLSLEVKASYSRDKKLHFLGEDMTTSREYQKHIWFYFLNLENKIHS
jgi:hypothetical protein